MYEELVKRLRNKGCQICPICREAANAIEYLICKVMELEDELGIYDELPLVHQREPLEGEVEND